MNLFDSVLASLNDPSRATQMSDLEGLSSAFGGGGSSTSQIASLIGGFLKPMLREQQAVAGPEGVDSLLHQIKQNADSPDRTKTSPGCRSNGSDGRTRRAKNWTRLQRHSPSPANRPSRDYRAPAVGPASRSADRTGRRRGRSGRRDRQIRFFHSSLTQIGDGDVDMEDVVRMTSVFLRK